MAESTDHLALDLSLSYLVDTHCHIHESDYPMNQEEVLKRAKEAGVARLICVGTNEASSAQAMVFARGHADVFAAVGVHPHEAKDGWEGIIRLLHENRQPWDSSGQVSAPGLVAVGEIGLDYHYTHSPRDVQIEALQAQIDIALQYDLPVIFHIREAFHDFWPVFDGFRGVRGVLHSFTDTIENLEAGLIRGLYIGVNGISTFSKDKSQQAMFQTIPLERLLLETDAPFLTPSPFRGKVNEPAYVREVARHQAGIRNLPYGEVITATTTNAQALFALI